MAQVRSGDEGAGGRAAAPRSVLVADDALYLTILGNSATVSLLQDQNSMIVPYSLTPEVMIDEVLVVRDALERSGQLLGNSLLVRSPYDYAKYEPADTALQSFVSAKFGAVGHVAGLLGARTVDLVSTRVDKTTVRRSARLGVRVPAFRSNGSVSREVAEEIDNRLALGLKFVGGEPKATEAREFLARRNLSSDTELSTLIDMRAESQLLEYTLTFNGKKEASASLDAALKLATAPPVKAVQVGAQFSQTVQSISTVELRTHITF